MIKIALLGAQGSGKSWLAASLATALPGDHITISETPLEDIAGFDMVLLLGLDLLDARTDATPARRRKAQTEDQRLRDVLAKSGTTFKVIYGNGAARLRNAVAAIQSETAIPSMAGSGSFSNVGAALPSQKSGEWRWPCDKCSDPQCEHQLFSRLLQGAGRTLQTG
jgi:hypothetical protein